MAALNKSGRWVKATPVSSPPLLQPNIPKYWGEVIKDLLTSDYKHIKDYFDEGLHKNRRMHFVFSL